MTIDPMIGKFFHAWKDGKVCMQGVVDSVISTKPKRYLVTTFSWLTGDAYQTRIVNYNDMTEWTFYSSSEDMINFYRSE